MMCDSIIVNVFFYFKKKTAYEMRISDWSPDVCSSDLEGQRYPAIIVTHGSDADDRFFNHGNQWNYPVQLFAERGYVVLLINDPKPQQAEALLAAYKAWIRGSGPPGPETLPRLIWINGFHSFEAAVTELAVEGLVDPDWVGNTGYSLGSRTGHIP